MSAEDVMDVHPMPPEDEESGVPAVIQKGDNSELMRGGVQGVLQTMNDLKLIRTFVASEMVAGVDYGHIPGTDEKKKNMLLPGAQKVNMLFNVRPEYEIERVELGEGHVEFIIKVTLISRATEKKVGAGLGSCSTMEGKYRYRDGEAELTDQPVPKAYWDIRKADPKKAAALIGGADYKAVKTDAGWVIARKTGEKVPNPNIHDIRNVVLKMAKKRALIDASIGLSCLSELFTQDLDHMETFDLSGSGLTPTQVPGGHEGSTNANHGERTQSEPSRLTTETTGGAPPKRSSNPEPGNATVVTIKSVSREDFNAFYKTDVVNAVAEDDTEYVFVGPDMISMAKDSKDFGRPLRLTDVKVNKGAGGKTYRNVRGAEWAD